MPAFCISHFAFCIGRSRSQRSAVSGQRAAPGSRARPPGCPLRATGYGLPAPGYPGRPCPSTFMPLDPENGQRPHSRNLALRPGGVKRKVASPLFPALCHCHSCLFPQSQSLLGRNRSEPRVGMPRVDLQDLGIAGNRLLMVAKGVEVGALVGPGACVSRVNF